MPPLLWGSVTTLGGLSLGFISLSFLLYQELVFIFTLCRVQKNIIISLIPYQQKQHGTWQCFNISIKTPWGPQMIRQDTSNAWGIRLGDLGWEEVPYPNPHCLASVCSLVCKPYSVCVQIVLILFILSFIYHDGPLLPPLTGKAPREHPPISLNPVRKHLPPGSWHTICRMDTWSSP